MQNNTWSKQAMCQWIKTKHENKEHLHKSMAKKEEEIKASYKQTALDKAANSIKQASITYKSTKIGRQSWLISFTFINIHINAFFEKGHQQSYDKAKPCTYVQWSRMQFSLCRLNAKSMS